MSDGLGDGEVVVFGAHVFEFVLDAGPDGVAGVGGLEEAAGLVGDGFEIADEGGAVGVVSEEGLEARVCTDVAVAIGEEVGEILFKVCRGHGVEVGETGIGHTATSLRLEGWADCSGWCRNSRSLRRALWSCDLLLPVEHSSMVAISLCSKPSTSWRTKTMR